MMRIICMAAAALLIAGCASVMSEEECAGADWAGVGERDGLYGETYDKLDERAERCAGFGYEANIAAYQAGRAKGLETYCTPDAGFDAGVNGRPYRGVCPAELEGDFLAEYNIGYRLFDLNKAVEDSISAYEGALDSLESHRHSLRRARERQNDEDLTSDEREKAGKDIDHYRREIDRLERDLPRLDANISSAEGRLADYRAFLGRRARRH